MKVIEENYSNLYHLRSTNFRSTTMEPSVDLDSRPQRFHTFCGSERITLPAAVDRPSRDFFQVLSSRRSVRNFTLQQMPLSHVAAVLYSGYGVRGYKTVDGEHTFDRQVPSAGGLYPLELYVASQKVEGVSDGIYHYDARENQLELLKPGMHLHQIADMTIGQEMIRDCHFVVFITGIFERTMWKYGQRGYRYVWIEAGHVGQNIYLTASALGMGAVSIGGFFDLELHELLRLPEQQALMYLLCVGFERESGSASS
jgi:SagB-type dehydrogenase family enzyme